MSRSPGFPRFVCLECLPVWQVVTGVKEIGSSRDNLPDSLCLCPLDNAARARLGYQINLG